MNEFVLSLYAYVDPGSGALVWQMLAAAAVGVVFYFRSFFRGIGKLFRRGTGKVEPTGPGSAPKS